MTAVESTQQRSDAFRWFATIVLMGLSLVAVVGSAVGIWAHSVLFDTDAWVEAVGPIGTDPVVTDAFAEAVSAELIEYLAVRDRLTGVLPDRLDPLGELVGSAADAIIIEETASFFASDRYEELWLGLNEKGHAAIVAFIRNQIPFISTEDGTVSVDLEPLLTPVIDGVIERLRGIEETIPDAVLDRVEFDEGISTVIAEYEAQGFPERLNDVVVYTSDRLAGVQQTLASFDRLVWVMPFFALLLALAAVLVAPRKLLMIPTLLVGIGLGWWAAIFIIDSVIADVLSGIASDNAAEVAQALLNGVTDGLDRLLSWLVFGTLVIGALTAWWIWRQNRVREQPQA